MLGGVMRAVDTNVLVRLIVRDEPKQLAAAEDFVAAGAWVSHLVLVEAVWVLATVYELSQVALCRAVDMFLDHTSIAVQDPEIVAAALASFRKKPKVGFSDCLVLELARRAGHLPLGTFDRELGKLRGAQRL